MEDCGSARSPTLSPGTLPAVSADINQRQADVLFAIPKSAERSAGFWTDQPITSCRL